MDKKLMLIKYILEKKEGGVADLWQIYKLMYFIDFAYYAEHKKSISGAEYYNWQYGPVPMNRSAYFVDNVIDEGEKLQLWRRIDKNQVQVSATADVGDDFTADELNTINSILDHYGKLSGRELVALSHDDMPWKMTREGEKIDYEYVFWRESQPDQVEDISTVVMS